MIDGYTHNSTLTSGDSVPLGTQLLLVCRVVGLPYGTPLNYTWTCNSEECVFAGGYFRSLYNDHILAVNTTGTPFGGNYTCQVTAAGRQNTSGNFTFTVAGTYLAFCKPDLCDCDYICLCMHICNIYTTINMQ